jgi:LacI family transcriptional regulator
MLFNALTELFQRKLDEFEYECDVFYLNEDDNEVDFAQRICMERKPEGILFLGANLKFFRSGFAGINVPCVLVTIDGSELGFENLSSVTTDDRRAAEHIIDMLVEHGHTKIGVIGGNPETSTASKERLFGCRRAFARNGIEFDEFRQYEKSHFGLEGGYSAAGKLFRKMPDVTAIYSMSDVTAIGAIRAAADRGIRIPEDLSIVGFDGIDLADYVTPRLTTIRQNREAIAARSIEILIDMIRGGSAVHEVIPFILIPGNSIRQI